MSTDSEEENGGFACFWRIENFSFLKQDGEDIYSPVFTVEELQNSEWKLTLERNTTGYLTAVLLGKCGSRCAKVGFSISFLKADGSQTCVFFNNWHKFRIYESFGADDEDLPILLQESCLQNGTLTVVCHIWNPSTQYREPAQCSIVTRLENDIHFFKLPLFGFFDWGAVDEFPFSVSCTTIGETWLEMKIIIKIVNNYNFKVQIRNINNDESSTDFIDCKLVLKTISGYILKFRKLRLKFSQEMPNNSRFIKFQTSNSKLSNNELILYCEFLIPAETSLLQTKAVVVNKNTQTEDKESDLLRFTKEGDLLRLFSEKKFTYVTLRTGNKEFAAHKALLCARSPVFRAMFEINMKENDSNTVNVDDVDGDTLSLFLRFLQFEPLGDLVWDRAAKLYYAAEKYQIDPLKNECSHLLASKLSEDNVCSTFILAETYNDESLKHNSLEFFCTNSKTILCSDEWKDFVLSKAEVAIEVLQVLAEKIKI